jgi:hypothetical protein
MPEVMESTFLCAASGCLVFGNTAPWWEVEAGMLIEITLNTETVSLPIISFASHTVNVVGKH